ncbi:hypothetical protein M3Y97_01107000 [Aphelenchoides bicaudatus]|nr:hypothetical protein M3Y97_01107000 [Aphelenchoides bicaudatus]
MLRFNSILLLALLVPVALSIECFYCGNKKDCESPRKTVCERGSCAKIERGESLQKGCYTMGTELRYNQEDQCFTDIYQRNVCTCNDNFCNGASQFQHGLQWTALIAGALAIFRLF